MRTVADDWDDPLSLGVLDEALGPEIHDHTRPVLMSCLAKVTDGLTTAELRALADALPPDDGTLPPFDRAARIAAWFRHRLASHYGRNPDQVSHDMVRDALLALAGDRADAVEPGLRGELEAVTEGVNGDQLRAIAGALAGD